LKTVKVQPQVRQQVKQSFPTQDFDDEYSQSTPNEDSHGVALKAAKEKWNELGPLRLEDIIANSRDPID
jgi:hypothetical protein